MKLQPSDALNQKRVVELLKSGEIQDQRELVQSEKKLEFRSSSQQ